jgi:hypothetical protein
MYAQIRSSRLIKYLINFEGKLVARVAALEADNKLNKQNKEKGCSLSLFATNIHE